MPLSAVHSLRPALCILLLTGCPGDDGGAIPESDGSTGADSEPGDATSNPGATDDGATDDDATDDDGADTTTGTPGSCGDDTYTCDAGCCVWQAETVDGDGHAGTYTSLAIDSSGQIHIAYRIEDDDPGDDYDGGVRYAFGNAGRWTREEYSAISLRNGYGVDLVLRDDAPIVSWFNNQGSYIELDGLGGYAVTWPSTWPSSTENAALTFVAVDAQGRAEVCIPSGSVAECMTETDEVDEMGDMVFDVRQAFVAGQDFDHMSFRNVGMAYDAAGTWHLVHGLSSYEGVFYAAEGGSNEVVSATAFPAEMTIAIDSSGEPHIAYIETGEFDAPDPGLYYAYRDGGSWTTELLDPDASHPSVAIGPQGRPSIAFHRPGATTLAFATMEDDGWDVSIVDAAAQVGEWPSLAFDADGNPHLSYYDQTNGLLKYATWTAVPQD